MKICRRAFGVVWSRPVKALVLCMPLLAAAQSAPPSLSGPSMARAAEVAEFNGRGFTPNAAVSIAITQPGGAESVYGAVVAGDGSLTYRLTPSAPGTYQIKVTDSGGRVIARATFHTFD
jgi:hypothetical protein